MTFMKSKKQMKKLALGAALVVMSMTINTGSWAVPFSDLFVFGDSLSDSGNVSIATGGAIPGAPYFAGRFSNGPNYADVLATELGLTLTPSLLGGTNFAFGGARSGISGAVPSVADQVATFLGGSGGTADDTALYVVFGGGNDLRDALGLTSLADQLTLIGDAVASLSASISDLASAGADRFIVPNAPNLGLIPEVTSLEGLFPGISGLAAFLSSTFNADLEAALAALRTTFPGITISELDTFGLVGRLASDPGAFGITNITDACLDTVTLTVCADPSSFLFWDTIHPTAVGHMVLGLAARNLVPEPGTLLVFAFGLAGLGVSRRRRAAA